MAALYEAYDKKSDAVGLGWADQWDYKFNDTYGSEGADSQDAAGKNEKLAKAKAAASTGVDKTKSAVTSGFKWMKEKVHKKPNQ